MIYIKVTVMAAVMAAVCGQKEFLFPIGDEKLSLKNLVLDQAPISNQQGQPLIKQVCEKSVTTASGFRSSKREYFRDLEEGNR
jgi:hypothetical protein